MSKYNKKAKTHRQESSKKTKRKTICFLAFPLAAVTAVIPLVMRYYEYDPHLQGFAWFAGHPVQTDLFLHCKMDLLIAASLCCMLGIFYLAVIAKKNVMPPKSMLPLGIYGVLALLSAFCSRHSYFSFHGIFQQFEPVWLLAGYCIFAWHAFLLLREEDAIRRFMALFAAGTAVMMLYGILQAAGHSPLKWDWYIKLIAADGAGLDFNAEDTTVYATLYNSNYAGMYTVLVMPVLFGLFMTAEKIWIKPPAPFLSLRLFLFCTSHIPKQDFLFFSSPSFCSFSFSGRLFFMDTAKKTTECFLLPCLPALLPFPPESACIRTMNCFTKSKMR